VTKRRAAAGMVYLVGAGPGRADLLTVRGARLLARADAVVVDALVNPRLTDACRPGALIVRAGKRGHGEVAMKQAAINRLLVRLARAGKTVVRLKGGDPYFFGRGGEEAEHLAAHRVPFEEVPGVSSVSAAPAYAGIPLTHRRHTSMVTVITGHPGRENTYLARPPRGAPGVDWERISPRGTLVVLMGVSQLPDIVRRLRANGWSSATPAAAVRWGTYPAQTVVEGNLGNLADRARRAGLRSPAVIVAGSVAAMRRPLDWFSRLPLSGRRVLVTRAGAQAADLAELLEEAGAEAVAAPVIRLRPLPAGAAGKRFLRDLPDYDGVIFTSANAAKIFHERWARSGRRWPDRPAVYAVGPKTAETLAKLGLPVHRSAREYVSDALLGAIRPSRGKRYLFPRAEEAREALAEGLRKAGAAVDVWPLYRAEPQRLAADVRRALLDGRVDAVTFASSATVRFFMRSFTVAERRRVFARTLAASIGPVTSAELKSLGVRPSIAARRATAEDLAEAVISRLRKTR
jgi:uroporphyrinogen III methyltransferase / synthase